MVSSAIRTFLQQSTFFDRTGNGFLGFFGQLELDGAGSEQTLGGVDGHIEQGVALVFGGGGQGADDFVFRDGLAHAFNRSSWVSAGWKEFVSLRNGNQTVIKIRTMMPNVIKNFALETGFEPRPLSNAILPL